MEPNCFISSFRSPVPGSNPPFSKCRISNAWFINLKFESGQRLWNNLKKWIKWFFACHHRSLTWSKFWSNWILLLSYFKLLTVAMKLSIPSELIGHNVPPRQYNIFIIALPFTSRDAHLRGGWLRTLYFEGNEKKEEKSPAPGRIQTHNL